ncbi:MAG: hypothetical protein ABFD60_13930 [Bryobacteraceae bacterium]
MAVREQVARIFDLPPEKRPKLRALVERALETLPPLDGKPIRIILKPDLHAYRGKLLSRGDRGTPVHAGSFLRRRETVLDSELAGNKAEFARILLHEIFHFVWLRAGNPARKSFEALLAVELRRHARGELGWSAAISKKRLSSRDVRNRTRLWREYVCESFCDTAAWRYVGIRRHPEFTLAPAFHRARRGWFTQFDAGRILI